MHALDWLSGTGVYTALGVRTIWGDNDCSKRGCVKEPNGPVDGDKGDRQQWVVDNREPADFQYDQYFHVRR